MLTLLLNGKLSLDIPDEWKAIEKSKIDIAIAGKEQPFLALSDEATKTSCMLFYSNQELNSDNFEDIFKQQHTYLIRMTPGYAEFGAPRKETDGRMNQCLIYKQNAPDGGELFMIFYMTYVDNRMLFGIFSCPYAQREKLNTKTMALIESITVS
jgi:hypothetical protein